MRRLLMSLAIAWPVALFCGLLPLAASLGQPAAAATHQAEFYTGMSCRQFFNDTPATYQQSLRLKTPPLAELRGMTCTTRLGGRTIHVPLTDRSSGVLYSEPLFCTKEIPGVPCINARGASYNAGAVIQLWDRKATMAAEQGSYFIMYRYTWVGVRGRGNQRKYPSRWPLRWRQAYDGWAVSNIEKAKLSGGNTGNCVTTKGSSTHHASNSITYYSPILQGRCSSNSTDTSHTMMVWSRSNSNGNRITPVTLDSNVQQLAHVSCIFRTPQTDCTSGDQVVMTTLRTPHWEHWEFPSAKTAHTTARLAAWPRQPSGRPLAARVSGACRGSILGQVNPPHTKWRWGTWWVTNPNSPPCHERSSMQCENTLNGDKAWYHGGWVKSLEYLSGDTCPLLAKVLQAGVDYGHNAGSPYTYKKIWPASVKTTAHLTAYSPQRSVPQQVTGRCSNDPRRACSACEPGTYFQWRWDTTHWKWEAEMTKDTSVPCAVWSSIQCHPNAGGNDKWFHGGKVRSIGVYSGVNCASGYTAIKGNLNWQTVGDSFYCYKTEHTFAKKEEVKHHART